MPTQLEILLDKMKALENELIVELQSQQNEFPYEIIKRRVVFKENVISKHKAYAKRLYSYLADAKLKHILSVPFIWSCIFPALLMDITISFYQAVCFPIYKIPKVHREDYFVFDRHYLNYLNIIEKINCGYCSYVNGLFGYMQEIGGRTEQFWCPIKHAKRIHSIHNRYQKFIEYGDAARYQSHLEVTRYDFKDL
jgi:hypothetical protein